MVRSVHTRFCDGLIKTTKYATTCKFVTLIDSWFIKCQRHIPSRTSILQFQPDHWQSSVSLRAPGPISRVDNDAGFMYAHPRSIFSPSVRAIRRRRLREYKDWHLSPCAEIWNLGMTNLMINLSILSRMSSGKSANRFNRLICHWHTMSYETVTLGPS